jgi:hypothetical protein
MKQVEGNFESHEAKNPTPTSSDRMEGNINSASRSG